MLFENINVFEIKTLKLNDNMQLMIFDSLPIEPQMLSLKPFSLLKHLPLHVPFIEFLGLSGCFSLAKNVSNVLKFCKRVIFSHSVPSKLTERRKIL